ncbi:hypothetical protein [Phyllobacterium zundukense]|uniref:Uncharacterized protein n=1 Tax=Phyllobacterium zundukense TaxID=1867719 RepID=A0A2N9W358_9HYPH|nr:hypothetical protein [Phyllobacterium zundukense]ATU94381.1 hypothetical protein BLM14_21820 [Phyllobacterium zundukense]PIO46176.1 hypothetical protein B5P45_03430 [Phyllobacterium zundukense]
MLKIIVWGLALVIVPQQAFAFCSRGFALDPNDALNVELRYLFCLHNEQNDALNKHAEIINSQGSLIQRLDSKIDELELKLDLLARELVTLRTQTGN